MSDEFLTEFQRNRSRGDAKRNVAAELRDLIESEGHSAYISEFRSRSRDDDHVDTFEVSFVVGLSDTTNPDTDQVK